MLFGLNFNLPSSPSLQKFNQEGNRTVTQEQRSIRGLPNNHKRVLSPAKLEMLQTQRKLTYSPTKPKQQQLPIDQTLGIRQRDQNEFEDSELSRPKKRSRTIGERVGNAVYNTVVVAGGLGAAAYRYWKGDNRQQFENEENNGEPSTSYSKFNDNYNSFTNFNLYSNSFNDLNGRIPGSFEVEDHEEDYEDVDHKVESPSKSISSPNRTPRKKQYKVNNRFKLIQSPNRSTNKSINRSSSKSQNKPTNKKHNPNDRLDNLSAQLSALIADGQKALTEQPQVDEEEINDDIIPPSSSFTFIQQLPNYNQNYSNNDNININDDNNDNDNDNDNDNNNDISNNKRFSIKDGLKAASIRYSN